MERERARTEKNSERGVGEALVTELLEVDGLGASARKRCVEHSLQRRHDGARVRAFGCSDLVEGKGGVRGQPNALVYLAVSDETDFKLF